MVCRPPRPRQADHLVTDPLAGGLTELSSPAPSRAPVPSPRCECDERPPASRAPIPGALPTTTTRQPLAHTASQPTAQAGPPPPGRSRPASPAPPRPAPPPAQPAPAAATLTPRDLARLQDALLPLTPVRLLLRPHPPFAASLRLRLAGSFFPAPSLPLDLGQPSRS